MTNPCTKCIEHDFCQGEFPCKRRLAFLRWKEKAQEISNHVKTIMERHRITGAQKHNDTGSL